MYLAIIYILPKISKEGDVYMKKRFLSVVLAIAMVFSCIPMSFADTTPNADTVKEFSQDGLEGTIDMKAGSLFKIEERFGNYEVHQLFENSKKDEMSKESYNGWQLMKIIINIPKVSGLTVNEIIPLEGQEAQSISKELKEKHPEYFTLQEDENNYSYRFYFENNGVYSFKIKYTLNDEVKETIISYNVNGLIHIKDIYMKAIFNAEYFPLNGYRYENKYMTEEYIANFYCNSNGEKSKIQFGSRGIVEPNEYIIKKVTSLDGIQYFKDNIQEIQLSSDSPGKSFESIESIAPIAEAKYGSYDGLERFEITVPRDGKPRIPENSYSPELIRDCVSKMPNLTSLYCTGSGFKDFTVFRELEGNKLDAIWSSNNGVTSIDGIQNHKNLTNLSINNNPEIAPDNNYEKNGVFDLTPLKDCKLGGGCEAQLQEINIKEEINAIKTGDKIRIELPMPIDIDGSLTEVEKFVPDTNEKSEKDIVKAIYGSEIKTYTAFEENGKKYIEIRKSDFDNKAEEILENIEFNFNFHNCNGKDNRTKGKFNGTVTFKATLKEPQPEEEYKVTYSFVSGTKGEGLPKEVTDITDKIIDGKSYNEGETVKAIYPSEEDREVKVENGVWRFKGYFEDGKEIIEKIAKKENLDKKGNIHFNGIWEFTKNKEQATIQYEFVNATSKDDDNPDINLYELELPKEIMDKLPKDNSTYEEGGEGKVIQPEIKEYTQRYKDEKNDIDTDLYWQFKGYYDEDGKELIDEIKPLKVGENVICGKWECKDVDKVEYKFESDNGEELPQEVLDELPEALRDYFDGEEINPQDLENEKIEAEDGVWTFKGWDKDKIEHIHKDSVFVGTWHFTPNGTGGGGTTPPDKPVIPDKPVTPNKPTDSDRVEGDDRIETAIEASEILFPNGTNTVVLSNCERFTDVLTANPFAIQENASALLTYKDKLPEKTLKEIKRLGAKKIYISGGYNAVSKKIVDELSAKGYEIFRFDGVDRYDTARKIAIKIREKGNKEVIELASGENFPDALAMTSMAVKDKAPILLTKKDSIPKYTKQALAEWDIENIKIAGLDEAISKEVEKQIDKGFSIDKNKKDDSNVYDGAKSINRFGGKDRYETSTIIATNSCPMSRLGVYATGENFPDALIAGNYAGRKNAPVLLVKRDTLPEVVRDYTAKSEIRKVTVIGGVNAVSDKVFDLIKAAINK